MSEDRPVTVEARFTAEGAIVPLAMRYRGRRHAIVRVVREWRATSRHHFEVELDSGEHTLLYMEQRPGYAPRWYMGQVWGPAIMA